jgi:hypothetical protein
MWNTRQERGRDDRALRLESWQQIMQDQRRRLLPPSPSTNVAPATDSADGDGWSRWMKEHTPYLPASFEGLRKAGLSEE